MLYQHPLPAEGLMLILEVISIVKEDGNIHGRETPQGV